MLQKISKIYPWQIELLPLFLLFTTFYLTLVNYPLLPDRIPTHFNLQGLADQWGDKSEILAYAVSGLFVFVLISVITVLFVTSQDPKRFINLPSRLKEKITPEQAERLRVLLVRCLLVLKTLIIGEMIYLLNGNIETALGRSPGLGDSGVLVFTAAILMVVVYMVYKSLRMSLGK